jgi:hypothetical protein
MIKPLVLTALVACAIPVAQALAQSADAKPPPVNPRPWGRVSFFTNSSRTLVDGLPARGFNELTSAASYQSPDLDDDGLDYGIDVRQSSFTSSNRPDRVAIYECYVGGRVYNGVLMARVGQIWLNDLGALGSVAGAVIEVRQPRRLPGQGRVRAGVFGGLEPNVLDLGYADNVKKGGLYAAYDGDHGRRHVLGLVMVRNGPLTERTVVTATNFLPVAQKFFVYQASEYDVRRPAGQGKSGLAYFFANVRYSPGTRVGLQGTYNRGRSLDARTLSDDVLNARTLTQAQINGFLYESIGGRLTVEVISRVRIYGGYSRDKNSRDSTPTGRVLLGGYASNVASSGFDLSASDSVIDRPSGQSYHSRYASLGRQLGRQVYTVVDYSTSLSVVRYSRSDGVIVALRPYTRRVSVATNINLGHVVALIVTVERTVDTDSREIRLLSGITYRFR